MPCSFGILPHPRSGTGVQPNGLLRVTVMVRWIPLVTVAYLVSIGVWSRPVADPSGAPVLRDQGPIGRPGTARRRCSVEMDFPAKLPMPCPFTMDPLSIPWPCSPAYAPVPPMTTKVAVEVRYRR
jgi:hypothetical protein